MILPKDILSQEYTKPRVFLCETDKTKICQLDTVDMSGIFRFNSYSEIEFSVGRTYDDFLSDKRKINPYYDKIEALRLINIEGFGYFEIQDPDIVSDGIKEEKTITAYSLEYNLSQKYLENFLVNTGKIGSIEVTYAEEHGESITPVVLYNPLRPELSLLHLALEKIYGWTIGHVDASLQTMSRQFEISRTSVYDFFTQDVCDKFNCFFVFDTINNVINVYAESLITKFTGDGETTSFIVTSKYDKLSSVSIGGYRTTSYTYNKLTGEIIFDTAPSNGVIIEVVDGSQEQWTTDVYVSFDNLAQEVSVSYSADDIKTVLTVKGADDLNIREVNYGLPYITDLSYYYNVDWMGQDLYDAYTAYLHKCDSVQKEYTENAKEMIEIASQISYLKNRLSLQYSIAHVTSTTVGTYYVRGGTAPNYYYTEVTLPSEYKAILNDSPEARKLEDQMKNEFPNSAVNLTARPLISWRKMVAAGYEDFANGEDDDYATVYSSSWNTEDFGVKNNDGNYFEVLLTPILPDGKVIENGKLIDHVKDELYDGKKLEELSVYIGSYNTVNEAVAAAKRLHELQEQYYGLQSWYYYSLSGNDLNEQKFEKFYEALKVYYTSKKVDDIKALSDDFAFVEEYTINDLANDLSNASDLSAKDKAVYRFLALLWNQLGLDPMKELYYEAYKKVKETNRDAGWDDENNKDYWRYYPVTVVLESLKIAQKERQDEIDEKQKVYDEKQTKNTEISSSLLLNNTDNFTHQQLIRLSSFLREDEYTDDNFVKTDVDTTETLMQIKNELLECGRIELSKLCGPKLEFSMSMANIYALEEFEPIISQFQLGKLINVAIRSDYVKRARLLEVNINFDDFSDFSCAFGELTNLKTPSSIHADLLASALSAGKSVASNSSYWDKGSDLATSTHLKIQQGLLSAIDGLYNSDQSVKIDETGILLRKVNEDGSFSPHQAWLTSNNILLSDDSFTSSRVGIGEFTIGNSNFYGVLAEAMLSGYIEGCEIVGGTINIGDGTFVVAPDGSVTMRASSIEGYVQSGNVMSAINQSPETITIDARRISLAGKKIDLTSGEIDISSDDLAITSTNFSVTKEGKITATSGVIAGWDIHPTVLRKEITVDGIDYQTFIQAADGIDTTNAFAVRKRSAGSSEDWDYQFKVNYAGKLVAKNAEIEGTIIAKKGSIAGYNIGDGGTYPNAIYKRVNGDTCDYEVGLKATSGATDLAFYVKESTDNWANSANSTNTFYIRNNGQLYAQNAVITGEVNASSGKIGGWSIGDMGGYTGSIYSTYCAASTPSSSNPEYAIFMRGKGSSASTIAMAVKKRTSSSTDWVDAEETFYVLKNGKVMMKDANVTGEIHASSGDISGNLNISGALVNTRGNYTVTLRGVQSDVGKGVFYITDNSSGSSEYPVRINGDGSARFTNVTITGNSTIASACIPNLDANKITSGKIDVDRLDASVITTGNFSSKTLSTSSLTMTSGCRLGAASEYNAKLYSSGGYTWMEAFTSSNSSYLSSLMNIVRAGVNVASSKDIKSEIHDFDNRYDAFFDKLNPQLFKYNFESNMGYSMGFIWEDAKASMDKCGLVDNDLGAIHESDGTIGGKVLRKDDFIALNTWQIQKLKARVEELESKLAALET